MPSPKISVIVPCYNYGSYLPETIDSVLAQTYSDYEIIIIDDESNDGTTPAVIKAQAEKDRRIKAIFNPKNIGPSEIRNKGAKLAKGKYLSFIDADDKIAPTYLEKTIRLLEKENADVAYSDVQLFGSENRIIIIPNDEKKFLTAMLFVCPIISASLYKKSLWQEFGGYDHAFHGAEDWDLWLKFIESGKKFVGVNEVLYYYRKHSGSITTDRSFETYQKVFLKLKKNHPNLYTWKNYYLTTMMVRQIMLRFKRIRRFFFQIRTHKKPRICRLFGIVLYKEQ